MSILRNRVIEGVLTTDGEGLGDGLALHDGKYGGWVRSKVKDIQTHLRHSRADATANEYVPAQSETVQEMVGSVYENAP